MDQKWNEAKNFIKPKVFFGFYNSEWYITIDDSKTIFLFISKLKQVFAVISSKCIEIKNQSGDFYNIPEIDSLHIISCTKNDFLPVIGYVEKFIYPIAWPS